MRKHTFTIFNADNSVHSYLFRATRLEAQKTVSKINDETQEYHYYMEGYVEQH
jgi:hypothetical protein